MEAKRSHEMLQPGALKYNIKDLFQAGRDVSSHFRIQMTMPEMHACPVMENILDIT